MALEFEIVDGTGVNGSAKVNDKNELQVRATNHPIQHVISERDGQAYQVVGDFASVNNSTHTILHLKNTSTTKNMYITYIRVQTVDLAGGTTLPSANTYWQVGTGTTYSSGGTAVTPVNVNFSSANQASATAYDNNPTLGGSFTETDRYYVQSEADAVTYRKEAVMILGPNDTIDVRLISDHTSGTAYARISFFYENADD
jgi:hypothetical protein